MANPGGIDIDDTNGPPDYEATIQALLKQMACDPVAALLLALIDGNRHDMMVRPFTKGDAALNGKDNAVTLAKHERDAHPEGVFYHLGKDDDPRTALVDERDERSRFKGTGDGSDVEIHFTPSSASGPGSLPDEVLFHEMVHGLREMQGLADMWPTNDSLRDYDNEEDFLAIVMTNVYISSKGGTQLRANHHGYHPLKRPLNTSAGFLADPANLSMMQKYSLSWGVFTYFSLLPGGPKFNPFRELLKPAKGLEVMLPTPAACSK